MPAVRSDTLAFEPVHHADRLRVVGQRGDVGLITLWSPRATVERKLTREAPRLLEPGSRIAVMANLYGDGLYAMLCNLLHNPQIRHLVAIGQDLGLPTADELTAFLEHGVEDDEVLGRPVRRIVGTARVLPRDDAFDAEALRGRLTFTVLGRLSQPGLGAELAALVDGLDHHDVDADEPRIHVELEPDGGSAEPRRRPSDPAAHQVSRRTPLDCWEELVVRCVRFGVRTPTDDGSRLELRNARAVIADPRPDPDEALGAFGFDPRALDAYADGMLEAALPDDVAYTYGSRMHDGLAQAIALLRAHPDTRRAFVSLWQPDDLRGPNPPCLVSVAFRRAEGRLTTTATFRSHNLMSGWLLNVHGLMRVAAHVAQQAAMPLGAMTVISQTLGIDPQGPRFAHARTIAEGWTADDDTDRVTGKRSLREDPSGYFVVSVDRERGTVIAEHRFAGMLVKRYEAARPESIEKQVAADMAITLASHAMWLGRELTRAAGALR